MSASQDEIAQTRIGKLYARAGRLFGKTADDVSPRHIGRVQNAMGVLAMARSAAHLVKLGKRDGVTAELVKLAMLMDGGTMNHHFKVQGISTSYLAGKNEKGENEFVRSNLGVISLAMGTEAHRVERTFDLFKDMLFCLQKLPYFGVEAEGLTEIKDLFTAFDTLLGDHGNLHRVPLRVLFFTCSFPCISLHRREGRHGRA